MAEVKWVKITTDMFDNRKIKHLRRLPDGNNIVLIWVMLLTMAGRCNAGGRIFLTEDIPYTPKMLADELAFEENTVSLALEALERLNMIVQGGGELSIANWEEYQNIEGMDKIREQNRARKQRQRQRSLPERDMSRDCHVTVTQCHALEEEEEGDKEKEKEIHSFNQAPQSEKFKGFVEKSVENSKRSFLQGSLGKGAVLLSDEQLDDLLEKLSFEEFNKYVEIVADNELCGKHYRKKTHYQAILDMAIQDRRVKA